MERVFIKRDCRYYNVVFLFLSRTWILNAIPAIGTSIAVRFTKEKFIAGELSVAETAQALIASVHLVTADLKFLNLIKARQLQICYLLNFSKEM